MKIVPKLASILSIVACTLTYTQHAQSIDIQAKREAVNSGAIGLLGGGPGGTYIKLANDLATLLDDGYEMRVLPTTGKGSVRGVEDLMYLRGIDIALIQSDVLDFYKEAEVFPNVDQRLRYITKLYNEELHLLARKGMGSIDELAGKKVNFGPTSSGTHMTSSLVFNQLGITVDVQSDNYSIALEKLKRGEIDAMIRMIGKPAAYVEDLPANSGLHLLSVPSSRISGAYIASSFVASDYPNVIEQGQSVETIAVGGVMAVYNWPEGHPRHRNIEKFIERFQSNFEQLLEPPYHPKWQEVSLEAEVPGWERF